MIVDIIGMPGSGKSTVAELLKKEFPKAVGKYDRKVKASLNDNLLIQFKEEFPEAWSKYLIKYPGINIDWTPEGPAFWREKTREKHEDCFKTFMQYRNKDSLLIWNKGITQIPMDVHMHSTQPFDQKFADEMRNVWPTPDLRVWVKVGKEFGRKRYRDRRNARMAKRAAARKYPGWTDDQYRAGWEVFQTMAHGMVLDNEYKTIEALKNSLPFLYVVSTINDSRCNRN